MKNKKDNQKKIKKADYKIISFIVFTIGFFTIFAIRPSLSLIYSLQKEKAEYEKINQTLETKIQQIIATQAQFMQLINNKSLVEQALPNNHQIKITQEFLNKKFQVNNFSVQKISILPQVANELGVISINLTGQGQYEDILNFLDFANNSRRLISLDFFSLQPEKNSTASGAVMFNSVLNTFYYSDET